MVARTSDASGSSIQGRTSSGPRCPFFAEEIEDGSSDAMDAAVRHTIHGVEVVTPCCGRTVSFNDFHSPWAAGFALRPGGADPNVFDLSHEQMGRVRLHPRHAAAPDLGPDLHGRLPTPGCAGSGSTHVPRLQFALCAPRTVERPPVPSAGVTQHAG